MVLYVGDSCIGFLAFLNISNLIYFLSYILSEVNVVGRESIQGSIFNKEKLYQYTAELLLFFYSNLTCSGMCVDLNIYNEKVSSCLPDVVLCTFQLMHNMTNLFIFKGFFTTQKRRRGWGKDPREP